MLNQLKNKNIYLLESNGYVCFNNKSFIKSISHKHTEKLSIGDTQIAFNGTDTVSGLCFFHPMDKFPILTEKDIENIEESIILTRVLKVLLSKYIQDYLEYISFVDTTYNFERSLVRTKRKIRKRVSKLGNIVFFRNFSILEGYLVQNKYYYNVAKHINLENVFDVFDDIKSIKT